MRTDVLMMLGNKAVVVGVGVVTSVLIARVLGPTGRGHLAAAVAFAVILVQIGSVGFQTANPYFAAEDRSLIGVLVTNSLWLAIGIGLILIALGAFVRVAVPEIVAGLTLDQVLLALAAVPGLLAMMFLQGIILGESRTVAYNVVEAGSALGTLSALTVLELTVGLTVDRVLFIIAAGYASAALIFLRLLNRHRPRLTRPDLGLMRRMAGYAGRIYLTGLFAYVVIRIDVLFVNGYLGATQTGYYSLAVSFVDTLYVLPLVVALNLFPRVLRGAGPDTTARMFRTVAVPYSLACLAAALLARAVIGVLYGAAFNPAAELFWWLAPGAFAYGMVNILSYHFAARGYPRQIVGYWLLGLIVNVAINVTLLPVEGTYIASLASSITYLMLLALHIRLFSRLEGEAAALIPRPGELLKIAGGALRSARP